MRRGLGVNDKQATAVCLFAYRYYIDHVWSWDLFVVSLSVVAVTTEGTETTETLTTETRRAQRFYLEDLVEMSPCYPCLRG